jgi:hypothetical protein
MGWYYLEKEFSDYADDIEGVNIHYLWTPIGGVADWENQRVTRFMPLVQSPSSLLREVNSPLSPTGASESSPAGLRKKILKLPQRVVDPQSGTLTSHYLLHHYFEIFQDGHRRYSPLYTEELLTDANVESTVPEVDGSARSSPLTAAYAKVKEFKE